MWRRDRRIDREIQRRFVALVLVAGLIAAGSAAAVASGRGGPTAYAAQAVSTTTVTVTAPTTTVTVTVTGTPVTVTTTATSTTTTGSIGVSGSSTTVAATTTNTTSTGAAVCKECGTCPGAGTDATRAGPIAIAAADEPKLELEVPANKELPVEITKDAKTGKCTAVIKTTLKLADSKLGETCKATARFAFPAGPTRDLQPGGWDGPWLHGGINMGNYDLDTPVKPVTATVPGKIAPPRALTDAEIEKLKKGIKIKVIVTTTECTLVDGTKVTYDPPKKQVSEVTIKAP